MGMTITKKKSRKTNHFTKIINEQEGEIREMKAYLQVLKETLKGAHLKI